MTDIFKKGPSQLERTERELKRIENELFREASEVVFSTVAHTFDIDPEDKELPAEWMAELQECEGAPEYDAKVRELQRRKRIAQYALLPPKEAPIALQIAAKVLGGMQKARAMEGAAPRELNLTLVSFSAPEQPAPLFPIKEIKNE